jgi:hypothetical protein
MPHSQAIPVIPPAPSTSARSVISTSCPPAGHSAGHRRVGTRPPRSQRARATPDHRRHAVRRLKVTSMPLTRPGLSARGIRVGDGIEPPTLCGVVVEHAFEHWLRTSCAGHSLAEFDDLVLELFAVMASSCLGYDPGREHGPCR